MIRTGRVVEAKDGSLKVCFDRPEMCASCGKCGAHGVHQELVTVQGEAQVGNWVQVEMPCTPVSKRWYSKGTRQRRSARANRRLFSGGTLSS